MTNDNLKANGPGTVAPGLAEGCGRRRGRRHRLRGGNRLSNDLGAEHQGRDADPHRRLLGRIKEIAEQASKDLGFKVEMQVVDPATQLNRALTQPKSFDINNIDNSSIAYLWARAC